MFLDAQKEVTDFIWVVTSSDVCEYGGIWEAD